MRAARTTSARQSPQVRNFFLVGGKEATAQCIIYDHAHFLVGVGMRDYIEMHYKVGPRFCEYEVKKLRSPACR